MDECIRSILHNFPIDLNDEKVIEEPISRRNVDGTEFILLNRPDYITHVLQDKNNIYRKEGIFVQIIKMFLGIGLATTEGKDWERQRQSLRPAFGKQNLDDMLAKMFDVTVDYCNEIDRHVQAGETIDINYSFMALTLKILAETLLSVNLNDEKVKELLEAEKMASQISAKLFSLSEEERKANAFLYTQYTKSKKVLDDFATSIIEDRKKSSIKHNDFLQLLIDSQVPGDEMRDQILSFLNGGHDTSAQALTWACYLLSQNKDVEAKLHADVKNFELSNYEKVTWPQMVFRETLRLFPPAYIIERTPVTDDRIGDVTIPAHANIAISPWVTHRNKNYWKNPFVFDPTRFAPGVPPNPAFIPFGGGQRVCIGQGLAMREATLILAALAKRYSFELVPKQRIQAYGFLTLVPRFGLKLKLKPYGD